MTKLVLVGWFLYARWNWHRISVFLPPLRAVLPGFGGMIRMMTKCNM
jgi:hypothetical protein